MQLGLGHFQSLTLPPHNPFPWCLPRFGALQSIFTIKQRELHLLGASSQGEIGLEYFQESTSMPSLDNLCLITLIVKNLLPYI